MTRQPSMSEALDNTSLTPALPAVAAARQAGDEAGAVAIAGRALEAAVPIAATEGVVRAREALGLHT